MRMVWSRPSSTSEFSKSDQKRAPARTTGPRPLVLVFAHHMADLERLWRRLNATENGAYDIKTPAEGLHSDIDAGIMAQATMAKPSICDTASNEAGFISAPDANLRNNVHLVDVCALCQSAEPHLVVHTMEAWAGKWHSACNHTACTQCLVAHVEAELPDCIAAGVLRITCCAAKCTKTLPQRLVMTASAHASWLADRMDALEAAPSESERLEDVARQLEERMQSMPGMISDAAAINKTPLYPSVHGLRMCAICCDGPVPLINVCGAHLTCTSCITTWLSEPHHVTGMLLRKEMKASCPFGGCCSITRPLLTALSNAATTLAAQFDRRAELQKNPLFPAHMQVDCRDPACLGIGYLGYDTVMCFICEEQWPAQSCAEPIEDTTAWEAYLDIDGKAVACKKCPKCAVRITKDGGCDHMTCRMCRHEWWWSTGKPYRTHGV